MLAISLNTYLILSRLSTFDCYQRPFCFIKIPMRRYNQSTEILKD